MSDEALLDALGSLLEEAADADDVLRGTVRLLAEQPGIVWAGIAFAEGDDLVVGPEAGAAEPGRRHTVPVRYDDATVGELRVDGTATDALLEEIANRIAAHVLLGWDTGGEPWAP